MAMFSVIVPVYKVEKYLRECIDSIINQTYTDFELILVDDGSPDNSPQICDEYAKKDDRIKVIHKENGGATSARIAGANIAAGDYIVCIDSDDWVELTYLENFANIINETSVDVVCTDYYKYNGEKKECKFKLSHEGLYKKDDIKKYIYPILIQNEYGVSIPNHLCTKAFKRELFVKHQNIVDRGIVMGEDAAVTKSCIYDADSIYILNKAMYYYRCNPSSVTQSKKVLNLTEPELRGKHFEKTINMNELDFKQQVSRMVTKSLFYALESQFNRNEKKSVIVKDIKKTLKNGYYQMVVKNCRFKYLKGKFYSFSLKYKAIWLINIFNSIKNKK